MLFLLIRRCRESHQETINLSSLISETSLLLATIQGKCHLMKKKNFIFQNIDHFKLMTLVRFAKTDNDADSKENWVSSVRSSHWFYFQQDFFLCTLAPTWDSWNRDFPLLLNHRKVCEKSVTQKLSATKSQKTRRRILLLAEYWLAKLLENRIKRRFNQ